MIRTSASSVFSVISVNTSMLYASLVKKCLANESLYVYFSQCNIWQRFMATDRFIMFIYIQCAPWERFFICRMQWSRKCSVLCAKCNTVAVRTVQHAASFLDFHWWSNIIILHNQIRIYSNCFLSSVYMCKLIRKKDSKGLFKIFAKTLITGGVHSTT